MSEGWLREENENGDNERGREERERFKISTRVRTVYGTWLKSKFLYYYIYRIVLYPLIDI